MGGSITPIMHRGRQPDRIAPGRPIIPRTWNRGGENPRGIHAVMLLEKKKDFTLDSLIGAAYDRYLPAFEDQIPALVKAWERSASTNPLRAKLADPVSTLRSWNIRWSAQSIPTSLAVYWGEEIERQRKDSAAINDDQLLLALSAAVDKLTADFGTWKTPWGDINRYQRLNGTSSSVLMMPLRVFPYRSLPRNGARWPHS